MLISSGMLVLDSKNQQGNALLPYNAATLAAFSTLFVAKLVVKLDWTDKLSKLKIYSKPVYTH